jgi:magnesium transporter
MIGSRVYRDGVLETESIPRDRLASLLTDRRCVVWLDLCEPSDEEWSLLTNVLGIHELAIEDAYMTGERAKLEYYHDIAVITVYATGLEATSQKLIDAEVTVFVAETWIITVRKDRHFPVARLVDRWDTVPDLAKAGPLYFVWGLLDVVVDTHMTAALDLEDAVDEIADAIFEAPPASREVQRRSFESRRSLGRLRRRVAPMPDIVQALMPPRLHAPLAYSSSLEPYLRDVHDHAIRAADLAESARDLVATIISTDATLRGDRLNEIMKKLTSWAAILAVPTIVFGFYGMNTRLYPPAGSWTGLWAAIGVVAATSATLFVMFRRRDWL